MADINALYQALRKADAAEDTEGARRLAQYIQQVQAAPVAPPAPPAPPQERTFIGGAKELFKGLAPGAVGIDNLSVSFGLNVVGAVSMVNPFCG